jgi:putative membrane protein
MMMDGMMGWGWVAMLFGALFWLAVFTLIVVAIIRLWPSRHTFQSSAPPDDALAILRARYARGEISGEEYETRRRDLEA